MIDEAINTSSQEKIARMQMLASLTSNLKPLSGIGGGNSMAAARKGGEMGGVTSLHPDSKDLKKVRK